MSLTPSDVNSVLFHYDHPKDQPGGEYGVAEATRDLNAILARHPEATGDALDLLRGEVAEAEQDCERGWRGQIADADYQKAQGRRNAFRRALHIVETSAQLQVQAPVGEGLENGAGDGERDALDDVIQKHWVATPGEFRNALLAWMGAAGYRKPTLPSVDEMTLAQKMHAPNNGAHSERGPGDTSWCTCGGNYRDLYEHRAEVLLDLLKRGA